MRTTEPYNFQRPAWNPPAPPAPAVPGVAPGGNPPAAAPATTSRWSAALSGLTSLASSAAATLTSNQNVLVTVGVGLLAVGSGYGLGLLTLETVVQAAIGLCAAHATIAPGTGKGPVSQEIALKFGVTALTAATPVFWMAAPWTAVTTYQKRGKIAALKGPLLQAGTMAWEGAKALSDSPAFKAVSASPAFKAVSGFGGTWLVTKLVANYAAVGTTLFAASVSMVSAGYLVLTVAMVHQTWNHKYFLDSKLSQWLQRRFKLSATTPKPGTGILSEMSGISQQMFRNFSVFFQTGDKLGMLSMLGRSAMNILSHLFPTILSFLFNKAKGLIWTMPEAQTDTSILAYVTSGFFVLTLAASICQQYIENTQTTGRYPILKKYSAHVTGYATWINAVLAGLGQIPGGVAPAPTDALPTPPQGRFGSA